MVYGKKILTPAAKQVIKDSLAKGKAKAVEEDSPFPPKMLPSVDEDDYSFVSSLSFLSHLSIAQPPLLTTSGVPSVETGTSPCFSVQVVGLGSVFRIWIRCTWGAWHPQT